MLNLPLSHSITKTNILKLLYFELFEMEITVIARFSAAALIKFYNILVRP